MRILAINASTRKNGHQSDMTWNTRWIKAVRGDLGLAVRLADSVSGEARLDFISRLPERFGLAEQLMQEAAAAREDWQEVGVLAEGKDAASHKI